MTIPADAIDWRDVTEWLPTEDGGEFQVRTIGGLTPGYVQCMDVPLDADETQVARVKDLIVETLRAKGYVA